jgi:energy-converting hydrogenase Eha subunit C
MSIGGILALQNIKIRNKIINEALSIIGLIMFIVAAWILDN